MKFTLATVLKMTPRSTFCNSTAEFRVNFLANKLMTKDGQVDVEVEIVFQIE